MRGRSSSCGPIAGSSLRMRPGRLTASERSSRRPTTRGACGERVGSVMKTWTATTTVDAPPEAVLDVLTDPGACARWAPVDFEVSDLEAKRLQPGSRPRVSGRIAGVEVGFDVEVLKADDRRLQLRCDGPVAIDVRYEIGRAHV